MHRRVISDDATNNDEHRKLVADIRSNDSSDENDSNDENIETHYETDSSEYDDDDYDERKLLSSAEFEANIPLDKIHDCVNFVYDKAVIPFVKSVFQTMNHGIDFFFSALSRHGKCRHEKK